MQTTVATSYGYDAAQEATGMTQGTLSDTYTYTPDGLQQTDVSTVSGESTTRHTSYDAAGRTMSTSTTNTAGQTVSSNTYTYVSSSGQDTALVQSWTENTAGTGNVTDTHADTYYPDNRLHTETVTDPSGATLHSYFYVYDLAGNMTNNGGHQLAYYPANLLQSVDVGPSYTYDGHGNLVQEPVGSGTQSYGYTAGDQTTSITTPGGYSEAASYTGTGQVVRDSLGSSTYQYDTSSTPALTSSDGGAATWAAIDPSGIAPSATQQQTSGAPTYMYIENADGSLNQVYDINTQQTVWSETCDPTGKATITTTSAITPLMGCGGSQFDQTSGWIMSGQGIAIRGRGRRRKTARRVVIRPFPPAVPSTTSPVILGAQEGSQARGTRRLYHSHSPFRRRVVRLIFERA